ncbi:hypothetical protein MTBPR1_70181 [Candidatus Terasakiella magnetica]|uniref:Uncharacterized protein n=1 Tax=Candidatus Terasakiella magnetica TaxID=1867952 RepID=A0A1C3RL63_9PROT|nr:hypothetical protein MTBPR1_70181 [Candidatus Terasakiella magnetica]
MLKTAVELAFNATKSEIKLTLLNYMEFKINVTVSNSSKPYL